MTNSISGDVTWLKGDITRDNNFDLIRLFAALQVVLLHSSGHLNVPVPSWFFNVLDYFQGVPIFFFMSGMLVTYSLSSSRSASAFYMKRIRRVFPALWLAFAIALLLLTAFGFLTHYVLKLPAFWLWVGTQVTFLQFYNPEFFRHFGTGVVNGSLWTISVEVGFYMVLPFIVGGATRLGRVKNNPRVILEAALIPAIALSFALSSYMARLGDFTGTGPKAPVWALLANQTFVPHFWLFGLGVLAYLRFETLRRYLLRWPVLLSIYLTVSLLGTRFDLVRFPLFVFATRLLLCATVLAIGAFSTPIANRVLRGWDLSYSLYVFHMLVLNSFLALNYQGSWTYVLIAICIAFACAALSWKYVERPSLRRREPAGAILWKAPNNQEQTSPVEPIGASRGQS